MKKYVKPELFYESFELSQQIAACDFDSNNTANDENCRFSGVDKDWGPITIFMNNCGNDGTVQAESYCYHNASTSPYGIFNS